jgi:PKD repeat protein
VPEFFCDQLEVPFENLSEDCEDHKWFFGGLEDPLATSTENNPTFTFPEFGTYDITLVSYDESTECNDTLTQSINILEEPFDLDIRVERGECRDTLPLSLIPVIVSDNLIEFSYLWEVEWEIKSSPAQILFFTLKFLGWRVSR